MSDILVFPNKPGHCRDKLLPNPKKEEDERASLFPAIIATQAMIVKCFRALDSLSLSRSRAGSRPGLGHSHVSQDKSMAAVV